MIEIKNGQLFIDKKPTPMLSTDYPYYRDSAEQWEIKLDALKELGVNVLSFYVPWRHHHIKTNAGWIYDFTGKTQGNRNLQQFMKLASNKGFYLLVKPGPFIHAETDAGGLPDFVLGKDDNGIQPYTSAEGKPQYWGEWILPSPVDSVFKKHFHNWCKALIKDVLKKHIYPKGKIIGFQTGNEGIYSDSWGAINRADYSPSGLSLYQKFLKTRYESIKVLNTAYATQYKSFSEIDAPRSIDKISSSAVLAQLQDWGEYQAFYFKSVMFDFAQDFQCFGLPILNNLNPPWEDKNVYWDSWISRIVPHSWEGKIHYGTTNWIGTVPGKLSSRQRYDLLIKRHPGPNLEENWGFGLLYDKDYVSAVAPFSQSLYALALGATGYNIYTGANTSGWDVHIDSKHQAPYPDSAPINAQGELTEKARVAALLNEFLSFQGKSLLQSSPVASIGYLMYRSYAHISAWNNNRKSFWNLENFDKPISQGVTLRSFSDLCRKWATDYKIVELDHFEDYSSQDIPEVLYLSSCNWMKKKDYQNLVKYLKKGGIILLEGSFPTKDISGEPLPAFGILEQDGFFQCEKGWIIPVSHTEVEEWVEKLSRTKRVERQKNTTLVVQRYNSKTSDRYFFIFNTAKNSVKETIQSGNISFTLKMGPGCSGIIHYNKDNFRGLLLKNLNDLVKKGTNVFFETQAGFKINSPAPIDLLIMWDTKEKNFLIRGNPDIFLKE